jgi:hypothetical protein
MTMTFEDAPYHAKRLMHALAPWILIFPVAVVFLSGRKLVIQADISDGKPVLWLHVRRQRDDALFNCLFIGGQAVECLLFEYARVDWSGPKWIALVIATHKPAFHVDEERRHCLW